MADSRTRIGIYLQNGQNNRVKLVPPEHGNPGIGGAQFLMFSLPYYLDKYLNNRYEFIFLAESVEYVDSTYTVIKVNYLIEAAQKAKTNCCDVFLYRPGYDEENIEFLNEIKKLQLKSIAWFHNTPNFILKHLVNNQFITRCVCVSRDQYEFLRDHPIIDKLTYIYNAVDATNIPYNPDIKKENQ